MKLLERFLEASESGDAATLKTMLAADAVVFSDGGGKISAARRPARVNGQPAQLLIAADGNVSDVLMLDIADDEVQTIRIIRNPDKLRHLQA